MVKDIIYYCHLFEKLRRDNKNGGAPHKPILLISLIQAYKMKMLVDSRIYITADLLGLFKSNWNLLVDTSHSCIFALPFYHMQTEPFWNLIPNAGCELWLKSKSSMRTFSNLLTAIAYAQIEDELSHILTDPNNADILIDKLLDKYFPNTKSNYKKKLSHSYLCDITNQITTESTESYASRMEEIRRKLDSDMFQEEVFIRNGIFKREIPKLYNNTCCISGLRIDALINVSMVDACHIIPFSESYNDTLTNGIALCPTLHRAFDRGLISIDDNYKVIISDLFIETCNSSYSIRQFEGKRILLPQLQPNYPSVRGFSYHRKKFNL